MTRQSVFSHQENCDFDEVYQNGAQKVVGEAVEEEEKQDSGEQTQEITEVHEPQAFHRTGNDFLFVAYAPACRDHVVDEFPAEENAQDERECDQDRKRQKKQNQTERRPQQNTPKKTSCRMAAVHISFVKGVLSCRKMRNT